MSTAALHTNQHYNFSPTVMEGLATGRLQQVTSADGELLPIAKDPDKDTIVEVADINSETVIEFVKFVHGAFFANDPKTDNQDGVQKSSQSITEVQGGIKSLRSSVGVLQSTTALIGVGTVATFAVASVSLYNIIKLREEVKQARVEIKNGFLDLKSALRDQGDAVLKKLDEVAEDVKFHQQKLMMMNAYGQFQQALNLIQNALLCSDRQTHNDTLNNALNLLTNALAIYSSPELYAENSALAYLRRAECAWAMEQAIAFIFHLRQQEDVVVHHINRLLDKMHSDALLVVDRCESEAELAVIFPELTRLYRYDVPTLSIWRNQIEWASSLPSSDKQQFASLQPYTEARNEVNEVSDSPLAMTELPEDTLYRNLSQISHFQSLQDQLRFMIKPSVRREREIFIEQHSQAAGYKALVPQTWDGISDQIVANLYWHLRSHQALA